MTKEQLEEYLERLTVHTVFLNEKLAILRFLKEGRWNDEKYRKTTHLSRPFFHFVEQSLQTDIIVTLYKLYAERSKESERSLRRYLMQVEMHLAKTFDREEIKEQIAEITKAEVVLEKIRTNRNGFYGHFDKKYFDNPAKLAEDAPINLDELSELVDLAKAIIRRHHSVLKETDYLFLEMHDAQAFFSVATGFIEYLEDLNRKIGV